MGTVWFYYNENNNWWPYFKYLNQYKARISSLLQQADMYTDMAILQPTTTWEIGVRTDPFRETECALHLHPRESINKNGGAGLRNREDYSGCDGRKGKLCYGPKKYGILFLPEVKSMFRRPAKLYEFIKGGKIYSIGCLPEKSLGLNNYQENDKKVSRLVEKLRAFPDRFVLISKPDDLRYLEWYTGLQQQYRLPHYLEIGQPDRYLMQTRYQADDKSEIFFFANAHKHEGRSSRITFSREITNGRYPWLLDPETGRSYRLKLEGNSLQLNLGQNPVIVFNKRKRLLGRAPFKPSCRRTTERQLGGRVTPQPGELGDKPQDDGTKDLKGYRLSPLPARSKNGSSARKEQS